MDNSIDKARDQAREQMEAYKKATEEIKVELTSLRTQKASEAKKTKADYEAAIPELEKKVSFLNHRIVELNKAIEDRNQKLSQEQANYKAQYDSQVLSLKSEYDLKNKALASRETEVANKSQELRDKVLEIEGKVKDAQDSLARERDKLNTERQRVIADENRLKDQRNDFEAYKSHKEAEIEALVKGAESDKEKATAILNDAERRFADLATREKKAQEAIDRINEVIEREKKVMEAVRANEVRTEELNQSSVEIRAEKSRLNKRSDALDAKEQSLVKREQNLKELEARV